MVTLKSTPLVYDLGNFTELSVHQIGAKASNLIRLADLGMRVPAFYVISCAAFRQTVGEDLCNSESQDASQIAAQICQRIETAPLAADLVDAIQTTHSNYFPDNTPVAVRSSAVNEDGADRSFAGMYDSVLGVRDFRALAAAIKRVWKSTVNPRVIAYRQHHGLPPVDPNIAVIIQQLIDADCSGVCFTCDPITGSSDRIVISSLMGLGEGLVSRGFAADTYRVDRATLEVEADLSEKRERLVFDQDTGVLRQADVEIGDRHRDSLSRQQVLQVAESCLQVESAFGERQDIEFCFSSDHELFMLQARPVTSQMPLPETNRRSPGSENQIIWDNSNIIESYCGATTPMTFSFIRRAYSIVYLCFAEVMGISPRVVEQHREMFNNMLGFFNGRVYYNLKNWYRLVRMFPGYHYNRRFMESMMGVKKSLDADDQPVQVSVWRRWLVEFPSLLKLIVRSGWNFLRIRKTVQRFEEHFYHHYDQWSKIDFDQVPPHEMLRLYDMMERKMLWNWKAPIINDFYVMIFYGLLRKLCVSWCHDETASLQNGLVCGEGGLQSDQPARLLIQMTRLVSADHALRDLVMHRPVEQLPNLVAGDDRFQEFNQLMDQYLDEFGLRCANELKLESYSYRDQPHRLYQIIRSYLAAKDDACFDLDAIRQRERRIRQSAEKQVDQMLTRRRSWVPRRLLFRWVLNNARLGVRNRENMRFARTRIYGILRSMLRSIGQQLADRRVLDDREDIFYLTLDEVWDFVKGTAVTTDLRGLANFRKNQYEAYRSEAVPPPADRFETFDLPYLGNSWCQPADSSDSDENETLSGIGCCPGAVEGIVQVVDDPATETCFSGDILVARRTDPGWVPFYPAFSGILVERGSVLSHSAIVAREMGIPTIVGVTGLTARIRSGHRVRMDGATGAIQVSSHSSSPSSASDLRTSST